MSTIFLQSLAEQDPRNAYFLAKKGLKSIADVVNDQGRILGFNDMTCRYNIGPHHCVIWNQVTELVLSLVPMPPLDGDCIIHDSMLQKGNVVIPINKITTHCFKMIDSLLR